MATKRRGGLRPPELRGTLGTLLRTTTGVVRDALERGAREGRARLDAVRSNSRRHDTLADLGELVLDLIRRGEIDLAELPEARSLVRQLDELDLEASDAPAPERPSSRDRFDDRPATGRRDHQPDDRPSRPAGDRHATDDHPGRQPDDRHALDDRRSPSDRPNRPHPAERPSHPSFAAERPSPPDIPERPSSRSPLDDPPSRPPHRAAAERPSHPNATNNDGTVSSGATPLRPTGPRAARPTTPARPKHAESQGPATADPPWDIDADDSPPSPPTRRSQPPHDPFRKGGISFDDDDLHEYMHPDDVPAKPSSDPDDGEP